MYSPTLDFQTIRHIIMSDVTVELIIRRITFIIQIAINITAFFVSEFKYKTQAFKHWYIYIVFIVIQILFYFLIMQPMKNFSDMKIILE